MRLINTDTLELSEFFGESIPLYAILSHTWEKDEVTLQEWTNPTAATPSKGGYKKICMACSLARRYGHMWLWVDTNCIDKTSSADLSEAINSMFDWYSSAAICFVYLFDVIRGGQQGDLDDNPDDIFDESPDDLLPNILFPQFQNSRWFTRGWTLQELVAPSNLVFYSRDWVALGSKDDFASQIATITGIDAIYLNVSQGGATFLRASVATRMSWLAKRKTTRIEDMAYCMLGLFDINMPLLYGEGSKAFLRLQEEIIKRYNDHSIFAWSTDHGGDDPHPKRPIGDLGFLASSPKAFASAGCIGASRGFAQSLPPWSITNAGISIKLPVIATFGTMIVILEACVENFHSHLGIMLDSSHPFARQGMLSRAVQPASPLHICRQLSDSTKFSVHDLYLKAFDRTRLRQHNQRPTPPPFRTTRPFRHEYGLLLSFGSPAKPNDSSATTKPTIYPSSVCFNRMGAFSFPTGEGDWLMTESTLFSVKTTGVVLGNAVLLTPFQQSAGSLALFTISIVDSYLPGKRPTQHVYSQFEITVDNPDWIQVPLPHFSPVTLRLVETEHQRVISAATVWSITPPTSDSHVSSPSCLSPEHHLSISQVMSRNTRIGCCDMCHPSFTSLRLAIVFDLDSTPVIPTVPTKWLGESG